MKFDADRQDIYIRSLSTHSDADGQINLLTDLSELGECDASSLRLLVFSPLFSVLQYR